MRFCRECGTPLRVGKDHRWNPDGTITQSRDPDHRMLFFDVDSLDGLFSNIEHLIGVPIEKIIIESKARATRAYISHLLRGRRGQLARIVGLERIIRRVIEQGRVMGYGDIEVTEFDWNEMYMYCKVTRPYSLPFFCGDLKGANEAVRLIPGTVEYERLGGESYLVKNYHAPHAPELEQRLLPRQTPRKPGDIRYDFCRCGVPREVSRFHWGLSEGTIIHPDTGLRMAFFGPVGLQVILEELENELGESIPATVIEAQRMYTRKYPSIRWEGAGEGKEGIRRWLAIQGMGNLVELEQEGAGFSVRIENPALPTILVGSAVGFYEHSSGNEASFEWTLSGEGDLEIEVHPVA